MLIDTSTLLRTLQLRHPQHEIATRAITVLPRQGVELQIVAQNLIELWVVATRSEELNGLGMTPLAVSVELARMKRIFAFLPETPTIYPTWEALVTQHQIQGKAAHDARLVAAMKVHGIASILTFDIGFSRYPDITVVNPANVTASS